MPGRRTSQPARRTSLTNLLLGIGAALATAAAGLVVYQRLAPAKTDAGEILQLPGDLHVSLPHLPSEPMRVIYLNREGATLTGETTTRRTRRARPGTRRDERCGTVRAAPPAPARLDEQ